MAKKPTKPSDDGAQWRSPPGGWRDTDASEYLVLRAYVHTDDNRELWRAARAVIEPMEGLLGPHPCRVSTSSPTPAALDSTLGWKQREYHAECSIMTPQLSRQKCWDEVLECCKYTPQIEVVRGGGEMRHRVWNMLVGFADGLPRGVEELRLSLALRHTRQSQRQDLFALVKAFFESQTALAGFHSGFAVVSGPRGGDAVQTLGGISSPLVQARDLQFQRVLKSGTAAMPCVYGVMAISDGMCRKLGGLAHFQKKIDAAKAAIRATRSGMMRLRVIPFKVGAMVDAWGLCDGPFHARRAICPDDLRLLHDTFLEAGLLAMTRPGAFAERLEDHKRWGEEEKQRKRERAAATRQAKRQPAPTFARTAPHPDALPRCILAEADRTPPPESLKKYLRHAPFHIRPHTIQPATTIYGRNQRGEDTLGSPILVGAPKPDRAALYFDARLHGWDGEHADPAAAHTRPLGTLKQLACPSCAGRLFEVWAAFEPTDIDELDDPEERARAHDFFTWFTLAAACASCQWTGVVADIECA